VARTGAKDRETPLFRQYWQIKKQHPDVLLLFRLGDFYELFFEDAEIAAPLLEVTLTSRPGGGGDGERIPMCGVPYHAIERYLARLIKAGKRAALCDQIEDPRLAKGLVRRKVTRVVTPGTVLEDALLDARSNNYLVALAARTVGLVDAEFGLAVCDVSTGEFLVTELLGESGQARLLEELERLSPAEVLLPEGAAGQAEEMLSEGRSWTLTPIEAEAFPRQTPKEALQQHFGVASLRGYGVEEMPLAIEAAALLLNYVKGRHLQALGHIRGLAAYSTDEFMGLDATARRNLELTQGLWEGGRGRSLLGVLDHTVTAMGSRLLRRWLERPLLEAAGINARLDAVEELAGGALHRGELRELLHQVSDLERLASRAATGHASPRDLAALRRSLEVLPALRESAAEGEAALLRQLATRLESLEDVAALIAGALVDEPPAQARDGGMIRAGHSSELDALRTSSSESKEWIARLEVTERERTGIASLKVGFNNVFGYYLEVTKANLDSVPEEYQRKQTLANAERYITPALKEREAMVLGAEEKITALEQRLFVELREQVGAAAPRVLAVAAAVSEVDALAGLAEAAVRNDYCRPTVSDGPGIWIRNGRHPVVEKLGEGPFIPNDCRLDDGEQRVLIITGPNMAGKSTYLRQVALIVIMAQMGGMVPADEAEIGVVDRLFTRVGAHDDLASGQSTFMVEMHETAVILNHATERSLVILDEIGRGTSTYDGLSIAWAVTEGLHDLGAKTLFATHYHHLNDLAERLEGVQNFRVAVKEDGHEIVWLRKIVPGGTDRSYGIQVARLAGLPPAVIERAGEILAELEEGQRDGGPAPETRIRTEKQELQLTLFELANHPAVAALRELDVAAMSPLEALNALDRLQKQAREG